MNELPSGWEIASVGDVTSEVRSGFASGKHNATGAGVPHLRPMNVSRLGEIDMADVKYVDPAVDDRRLKPGDILFNNTNSPVLVGKTALVRQISGEVAFSNHMTRLRTLPGLDPAFLAVQLHFLWMTGRMSHLITNHVNQASISAKVLAQRVQVAVPPASEQERIVAAIEEHLSRLDAAEAAVSRASLRLPALLEGMMTAVFEREAPMVEIGHVAAVGSGATPKRTDSRYWEGGGIPWVTSGALNSPIVTAPSSYVTEAALAETAVKLWPAGTVLVAMYGEGKTRGRAAELAFDSTCNQACAAIRVDPSVMRPRFLRWFLNSRYQQNRRLASGGVQPNLSLGLVKAMKVPLVRLEEQDAIVENLERSKEATDRLRTGLVGGRSRSQALRRSILAAAFSGQLVPQEPGDEPADMLLERIRAERAAATPTKRTRKAKAS